MAGRELVLEPAMSQLVAADVIGTSCRGDLEHVGIDIDELDANSRERIEDRGGEISGPGSEINDEASVRDMSIEPVDDGRKHALVVRDELADCPVVVVGGDAEVTGDTVLVSHRPTIPWSALDAKRRSACGNRLGVDLASASEAGDDAWAENPL